MSVLHLLFPSLVIADRSRRVYIEYTFSFDGTNSIGAILVDIAATFVLERRSIGVTPHTALLPDKQITIDVKCHQTFQPIVCEELSKKFLRPLDVFVSSVAPDYVSQQCRGDEWRHTCTNGVSCSLAVVQNTTNGAFQ